MRRILLFSTILGLSLPAFAVAGNGNACPAQALRCVKSELATLSQSGHSLVVEFPGGDQSSTAVLEDLSFSKEQQIRVVKRLAELPCQVATRSPSPDSKQIVLTCQDPALADAGYLIELEGADLAGLQQVRVVEHRFVGDVELARLPCLR